MIYELGQGIPTARREHFFFLSFLMFLWGGVWLLFSVGGGFVCVFCVWFGLVSAISAFSNKPEDYNVVMVS